LVEQMHALERREVPSRVKGQIGSRLMNERRREKPALPTSAGGPAQMVAVPNSGAKRAGAAGAR